MDTTQSKWFNDLAFQVDEAAKAAGEAAAEEVRATAVVAALNASRRLQTKIASDTIKQSEILFDGILPSNFETYNNNNSKDEKQSLINSENDNNKINYTHNNCYYTTKEEYDDYEEKVGAFSNIESVQRQKLITPLNYLNFNHNDDDIHLKNSNQEEEPLTSRTDVTRKRYYLSDYNNRQYYDVISREIDPFYRRFTHPNPSPIIHYSPSLRPPSDPFLNDIKNKLEQVKNNLKLKFFKKNA